VGSMLRETSIELVNLRLRNSKSSSTEAETEA
jgi:hypothetical protein